MCEMWQPCPIKIKSRALTVASNFCDNSKPLVQIVPQVRANVEPNSSNMRMA